ncbi:MAG: ABC transporter permease [Candidatus Eisenbacteria bacterium]|uniref:Transport permease protein n=1 Tax=Eiseniibacteriota bacterium TaxID=2212470 RepID=A0A7Y2E6K2_UNCEI|nr:ABC transporter permease [Candidatus Eisenbacteria bacterium]
MNLLTASGSLWLREIVRFFRQPNRVVGAIGTPLLFWFVIGSGVGDSLQTGDENYLNFMFPGILLMILLFTAIFANISIIQDRREGFMQSVLVAPVSRLAIVLGKVLGGTSLAFLQCLLLLAFLPLLGIKPSMGSLAGLLGVLAITGIAMTALGFLLAWRMQSIQGFHAIMNLLLLPMWVLSGALFSMETAAPWIRALMKANPFSYALDAFRYFMGAEASMPIATSLSVITLTAVVLIFLSVLLVHRPTKAIEG